MQKLSKQIIMQSMKSSQMPTSGLMTQSLKSLNTAEVTKSLAKNLLMKQYPSGKLFRRQNHARKHPQSPLHQLPYLQFPQCHLLFSVLLRTPKRRRKNARSPLCLPSIISHVPQPPPQGANAVNITHIEKMATGLFVIWLFVVMLLTIQIHNYKSENKKLKEFIKRN